jgi:hypothetical protein
LSITRAKIPDGQGYAALLFGGMLGTEALHPQRSAEDHPMSQSICLALPLLPGASDHDRDEMAACWRGPRAAAHSASRARHGITREAVWIQTTPAGNLAVVLLESDDLAASLGGVATSSDPFDIWFREHVLAVHGVDLTSPMSLPEQILDYSA